MRVTNRMLNNITLNNINHNLIKMGEFQQQLSSGKRVNKPSDDPIAVTKLLMVKSTLAFHEQYTRNVENAKSYLDMADTALDNATQIMQRAREIAGYGATGTVPQASMEALAEEVNGLVEELIQVANSSFGGRYIFGGTYTTMPPFTIKEQENGKVSEVQFINSDFVASNPDIAEMLDNTYRLEIEVETGVTMDISSGKQTFHTDHEGQPSPGAIFNTLIQLRIHLENGDKEKTNQKISEMDQLIDNILSERAVVGAKSKRMELAYNRFETYKVEIKSLLGKLEDVDYAEAMIRFKSQETVYQAALAASAKIIQPTLINYLK
ncbi:MAG: flagellar hook-associated protein FlgL [Syntrophomonadaceae bacterium]|jgi:flagellar hook-associated protein 3 FlgL